MVDHPKELRPAAVLGTKYSRFITYPAMETEEAESRVQELTSIGITKLCFTGSTLIDGIPVLGKGCVGLVLHATLDHTSVALKVRRLDADRPSFYEEGRLLRLANSVNVGPRLFTVTRNFLVMEFIDGLPLSKWVNRIRKRREVKVVLKGLLEDCFKLDSIGLDHGELSHAPKNVLVNQRGEGRIVDFESASTSRRVANVTSLIQYFLFGQLANKLESKLYRNRRSVIRTLTEYKKNASVASFQRILEALELNS